MRIVTARSIIIGECEISRVDTRGVSGNIRHTVRAAGAVRAHDNITQIILHEGAKNDRPDALFLRGAIDPPDSLVRLVNARHKWQSYWSKFQAFEMRHETVAHGFRSHT